MPSTGVFPGPQQLGRGAIIGPAQDVPSAFSEAEVFEITESSFGDSSLTQRMHQLWAARTPYVVRLHVDPKVFKEFARETNSSQPYELGDGFLFERQRLHFLTWNNNWDCRSGEPVWWWQRKATSAGATAGTNAEVMLPDGSEAYCDGGPPGPVEDITVVPYTSIESGSLRSLVFAQSKAELAPDQRAAVEHGQGPARIIAPAGSGKTRVLTERLRLVLSGWGVESKSVCAVAYNTRAARELTERSQGTGAHIRTLNSLALAVVTGSGGFMRSALEDQARTMLDEREVRNLLSNMVDLPRKTNSDPMAAWLEALSSVRLGLVSPSEVEAQSDDVSGFSDVFYRYRERLAEHHLLDFDEQIYRAIEILLQDPAARLAAQKRCRMLLVDEFQDLTPAHMLLLRLLSSPALDVFGVGDDDQVIYGYAGADPKYLVNYDSWFPGARHHPLEVNYRCPVAVVAGAANTLTRNAQRVEKRIGAPTEKVAVDGELDIRRVEPAALATTALDTLTSWIADTAPSNLAVLSRVNVTLLSIQVLLTEAGVPHNAPVDSALLGRTGIRTALAYMRIGIDPDAISRADITDTVRRPSRRIARNVVDLMTKRSKVSLADLRRLANSLSGNDGPRVAEYVADLEAVRDSVRANDTAGVIETIRTRIGLGEAMGVLDSSRKEVDRSTHSDDLAALAAVAHLHPQPDSFEPWLRSVINVKGAEDGVELSTVHRVKGREWDRVVVFDASSRLMPHELSTDRAEERRIFHVALTRCREKVVVVANAKSPSPFLEEMDAPGEPEVASVRSAPAAERSAPAGAPKVAASVGMLVVLKGGIEGTVVDVNEHGVTVSTGRARTSIGFGSPVTVDGRLSELGPPRKEGADQIVEALKEWRRSTAAQLKVPAYTVMHDSHLEGIADAAPTTLAELGRCRGIGTTKLDRWGDEILTTVEAAASKSATP